MIHENKDRNIWACTSFIFAVLSARMIHENKDRNSGWGKPRHPDRQRSARMIHENKDRNTCPPAGSMSIFVSARMIHENKDRNPSVAGKSHVLRLVRED